MLNVIEENLREELARCYELNDVDWPIYFYQYVRGLKSVLSDSMRYEVSKLSINLLKEMTKKEEEEDGKEI